MSLGNLCSLTADYDTILRLTWSLYILLVSIYITMFLPLNFGNKHGHKAILGTKFSSLSVEKKFLLNEVQTNKSGYFSKIHSRNHLLKSKEDKYLLLYTLSSLSYKAPFWWFNFDEKAWMELILTPTGPFHAAFEVS